MTTIDVYKLYGEHKLYVSDKKKKIRCCPFCELWFHICALDPRILGFPKILGWTKKLGLVSLLDDSNSKLYIICTVAATYS